MDPRTVFLFDLGVRLIEARWLGASRRLSLFASDLKLLQEALEHPETSKLSAYIVVNPLRLDRESLLAKGVVADRLFSPGKGQCTSDADILFRHSLHFDFDPVRAVGTASTPAQRALSVETAQSLVTYLGSAGFPNVRALIDSGSGTHSYYRTHLENNRETDVLLAAFYAALKRKFGSSTLIFDTSVRSAAQLMRLPGSMNHKAQRRCEFVSFNADAEPVTLEQIRNATEKLCAGLGLKKPSSSLVVSVGKGSWTHERMEALLDFHDVPYSLPVQKTQGLFWMVECPFNPEHQGSSCAVFVTPSGWPRFRCQHASCAEHKWKAFVVRLNLINGRIFSWKQQISAHKS